MRRIRRLLLAGSLLLASAPMAAAVQTVHAGSQQTYLVVYSQQALPAGARSIVLDAPADLRRELDPWGPLDAASLALMRRIKARFDPANACNPGVFVGGI